MFKYFDGKINRAILPVLTGRTILRVSVALLGLFLPIFLYGLFDKNISYVLIYYIIGHFLYGTFLALGCIHIMNRIGYRNSIIFSSVVGAFYYISFYFITQINELGGFQFSIHNSLFVLLVLNIILLVLWRIVFWTPIHTDMAKFMDSKDRGKELGAFEALTFLISALGPIFAGWIIVKYNYDVLFVLAIVIYFITIIPFSQIQHSHERFSWSYIKTWKKFFEAKRRREVLAYAGNGAERAIDLIVWPIFIFELLDGNYLEVGAISSLVVVVTVFLQLFAGKLTDKLDKKKMIHWGSAFCSLGWLVKIFITTAFQIFIVSTLHNFSRIFSRTPFDALFYEKAIGHGHYVDEYTVIEEMAIQFGKVFMLGLLLIILQFASLPAAFLLVAMASLFMNFLVQNNVKRETP